MKTLIPLFALSALLACLTACSDAYTKIDASSRESFLESAADLMTTLPTEQRGLFDVSLIHLQHDQDFSELDGMNSVEILQAEEARLTEVKAGRIAKLEKFEGYQQKFIDQGSEVPQNIATTLKEVREHIKSIDINLAVLGGDFGDVSADAAAGAE